MSQVSSGDLRIGAAVMTGNGNIYQGMQLDAPLASAYGNAMTAEDCAVFRAQADGQKDIKAIAVHVKHLIRD